MAELSLPDILNDCIDRLAAGQSMADCLGAYPAQAARLRPLLDSGVTATQANFPAAEMALVQERIWVRMESVFTAPTPSRPVRIPRRWQWALVAAAALLLVAGVIAAAQNSQPGDPLYGVRLFIESILPGTAPLPTETPTPTATLIPSATNMNTPVPTDTAIPSATHTETPAPTDTPLPTATPTATLEQAVTGAIAGPVESINGNVIVIYGIEIIVNGDNPLLDVIQVGDMIRVEGDFSAGSVTIDVTDIEVVGAEDEIFTSESGEEVWRDDGTCNNPPPDWAPANGWRRRCQGGAAPAGSNPGMGMGMGNGSGS